VEQAFNMFINKEHLQSWLPLVTDVTPMVGGKYEITWPPKTKKNTKAKKRKIKKKKTTIGCKIIAYEPNKIITFEWNGPFNDSHRLSSQLHSHVTVYFLPLEGSKKNKQQFTEVHLILTGWEEAENYKEARKQSEITWTDAIEKLIEHVNNNFNNTNT